MKKRIGQVLAAMSLSVPIAAFAPSAGAATSSDTVESDASMAATYADDAASAQPSSQAESTDEVADETADETATAFTPAETEATIPVTPLEPAAPAPVASAKNDFQRLDDIVVTATKRERSSRDIPVSISAVRGEDLEAMGARDIKDYMMLVPGLTMDEDNKGEAGGRRLTVRGIGPSAVDGNQTVGQFIGDVPMTDPVGNRMTPDLDPFDLKTVEVLKGPQGTTFGATALNGAIRYVPNTPELGRWQARGFADVNSVKFGSISKAYGVAANVPLAETLAFRGVGVLQDAGGLYDNVQRDEIDADSRRKWSARGMLHWQPWEPLSVDLVYLKQRTKLDDLLVADNAEIFSNSFKPGPSDLLSQFSLAGADVRFNMGDWGSLVLQSSSQDKKVESDSDASLRAIGQNGIESIRGYTRNQIEGRTHELRWVSDDGGRWNWIVGAFTQDYRLDNSSETYVRNPAQFALLSQLFPLLNTPLTPDTFTSRGISLFGSNLEPLTARERSLYGELSRRLGESWEVTVGGRRYETEVDATIKFHGAAALVSANGGPLVDQRHQSDKGFSPKVSVAWKPRQGLMMYGLVARGFQFGGVNTPPLLPVPNPVTGTYPVEYFSSTLWNREIGVRTEWLDRTLRLDATVYDIDWSDAQIKQFPQNAIFAVGYIGNIGRIRSQGIESVFTWLTPLPGLTMNVTAAFSNARTATDSDNNGTVTPAGAKLPAAPPLQVSTSLMYSTYLGPWVSNGGLTYSYWSKSFNNLQQDFEIYDFQQLSLNFGTSRPDWPGRPALTLGLQNITDERGLIGRFGVASGAVIDTSSISNAGVGQGWTYIRPRNISLRLTAEFD